MADMVLGKQQARAPVHSRGDLFQLGAQQILLKQLFLDPDRHGPLEGAQAPRREGHVGFKQALELEEGLVVEGDVVDVLEFEAGFGQTIGDCVRGKALVVLSAREALLLRGRDDPAVDDEGGGAVVIEGGEPENVHRPP